MFRKAILGLLLVALPVLAAPAGDPPVQAEKLPEGALFRIGSPRLRHGRAAVICVALSPDGKVLASVGNDQLGKLWDLATGKLLRELKGHTGGVQGVAFTPDGKQVLTGSLDMTLRLWDVATGKEVRKFSGHQGGILPVAISPDGKLAASEAQDAVVRVWDLATGKEVRTLAGHTSQGTTNVAFSPDSKVLATVGNEYAVHFWDVATGQEAMKQLTGHTGDVNSLEFSPDGKSLLTASSDGSVRLWNLATSQQTRALTGHTGMVSTARFSPDGKTLFSGGTDGTLRLWDVATGKEIRRFLGHRRTVSEVVITPDGKIAATAGHDGTLRLWDVATGQELPQSGGGADWADLSPDGQVIAASSGGLVRFFDAATGKALPQQLKHSQGIVRVAFGGNKKLATLDEENNVLIWDLATGKSAKMPQKNVVNLPGAPPGLVRPGMVLMFSSLSFSSDAKLVIAAGSELVCTWDAQTGKDLERTFSNDESRQFGMQHLVLDRDGRQAATIYARGDQSIVRLWDAGNGQEPRSFGIQPGPDRLAFSADGRILTAVGGPPNSVRVTETATGLEAPPPAAAQYAGAGCHGLRRRPPDCHRRAGENHPHPRHRQR